MKSRYFVLTAFILTGCNGNWKPYENRNGLLAEPAGVFIASADGGFKNCNLLKIKSIDPKIKEKDQFTQTKYIESGERSIFMKLTTDVKESSAEKINSTVNISDVQGFDIGDVTLEKTCDSDQCTETGNEGAPRPVFEFEDCYLTDTPQSKKEGTRGKYVLKSGIEINAQQTKTISSGHIFCRVGGENKSIGNGTIVTEIYSSGDLRGLPSMEEECNGLAFFVAKTVVLENGKKIEYVRNEIIEAPLVEKKDEKEQGNKGYKTDEKSNP